MKKYIGLFLISLFFFAISSIPVGLFSTSINKLNLQITSLEGSVWQGRAYSSQFGVIDWDFSPLALMYAQFAWEVKTQRQNTHQLEFDLGVDIFEQLTLENIKGFTTSTFLKELAILPQEITDFALFDIQPDDLNATWDLDSPSPKPQSLKGVAQIKKLNILGKHLGDYRLEFNGTDEQISTVITAQENAKLQTKLDAVLTPNKLLSVQGSIQTNHQDIKLLLNDAGIKDSVLLNYQF